MAKRTEAMKLVYILSPGHSGSTLLGLLLGAHPAVATVGEMKMAPTSFRAAEECSCGKTMTECRFWLDVNKRLVRRGFDLHADDFQTHHGNGKLIDKITVGQVRGPLAEWGRAALLRLWPAARQHWRHTLACNRAMCEAILDVTGRRVLLDTSKDASRLRYLRECRAFDIRVLYLVRDGRAVSYSMIRKGSAPSSAAREWVHEHTQAARLRKNWGDASRWMQVHYEALCEQPRNVMDRVCDWIDLPRDPAVVDFRAWDSHILGNRMRLGGDSRIVPDTTWREKLKGQALDVVASITAPWNQRFGYW